MLSLEVEIIFSCEMLVATYETKQYLNPEDQDLLFLHPVIISNLIFTKFKTAFEIKKLVFLKFTNS